MKKFSILLVIILAIAAIFFITQRNEKQSERTFNDVGYIVQKGDSYVSDNLFFIYEEPGSPALSKHLVFNEESICSFEGGSIQCMALSSPLYRIVEGKRLSIEGTVKGANLLVKNLRLNSGENGQFGRIKKVERNGVNALVTIDEVEFLSGDKAVQAIFEDLNCPKEKATECVPSMNNDFYIRNISTSTEVLNLTADSKISLFKDPGSPVLEKVDLNEFIRRSTIASSQISLSPFKIERNGATVTSLEQQYTP